MKRSERMVVLTQYFLENPRKYMSLTQLAKELTASKSSISEDMDILEKVFQERGIGYLERNVGAMGGVQYIPKVETKKSSQFIHQLCEQLADPIRILPGGYLYMSDLLGNPTYVRIIGKLFASVFADKQIDVVMTVETKGIPLAYAVASFLNVPVIIVRQDPKVTEGSSVSINYVSGSSRRIQTMVLPKRSLQPHSNVCIIDDFMKAGGTITGMISLLEEFEANVVAIGVLAEADDEEDERIVSEYTSLVRITNVDLQRKQIDVHPGRIRLGEIENKQ